MIGATGGVWRGALVASFVFLSTVALTVALTVFVFRPLITPLSDGVRLQKIDVLEGRADYIDRPKHWGEGPVVGPAFSPQEPTWSFTPATYENLGFAFRAPGTWGCMGSDPDPPDDTKLVCRNDAIDGAGSPSGVITVRPCPGPCDPRREWRESKEEARRGVLPGPVKVTDPTTAYVEYTKEQGGRTRYTLLMKHFWDREGDGRLDASVTVSFSAPPERKAEIQKTVNDIREAT